MSKEEENFKLTMMPGSFTRKMRTCVIWQFIRCIVLNIKMLVVVSKSH